EDGIRDFHVTGVQTCALPISRVRERITLFAVGALSGPGFPPVPGFRPDRFRLARVDEVAHHADRRGCPEARGTDGQPGWLLQLEIGRASCRGEGKSARVDG